MFYVYGGSEFHSLIRMEAQKTHIQEQLKPTSFIFFDVRPIRSANKLPSQSVIHQYNSGFFGDFDDFASRKKNVLLSFIIWCCCCVRLLINPLPPPFPNKYDHLHVAERASFWYIATYIPCCFDWFKVLRLFSPLRFAYLYFFEKPLENCAAWISWIYHFFCCYLRQHKKWFYGHDEMSIGAFVRQKRAPRLCISRSSGMCALYNSLDAYFDKNTAKSDRSLHFMRSVLKKQCVPL